jgi:AcrR family transcriptional regulator
LLNIVQTAVAVQDLASSKTGGTKGMGIAERREREKEALRTRILEAARDIVSEEGLNALSMRAIADRIEYSPATLYLYFRDKDELVREVVRTGFQRLQWYMGEEVRRSAAGDGLEEYRAMGIAYARFALENTAYFRVMFELPAVAQLECPCPDPGEGVSMTGEPSFGNVAGAVERAVEGGLVQMPDAYRGAVIGWGLIHGLTSLYLSGHLREMVQSHEQFLELVEEAQRSLYQGWRPSAGMPTVNAGETEAVTAS